MTMFVGYMKQLSFWKEWKEREVYQKKAKNSKNP